MLRAFCAAHALNRRGDRLVHASRMVRITAGFDERPHRIGGFCLAQQNAMPAATENLTELPSIEPYIRRVDAVDRCLDDNRRRAVAGPRWAAVDQPSHVRRQTGHVEGTM